MGTVKGPIAATVALFLHPVRLRAASGAQQQLSLPLRPTKLCWWHRGPQTGPMFFTVAVWSMSTDTLQNTLSVASGHHARHNKLCEHTSLQWLPKAMPLVQNCPVLKHLTCGGGSSGSCSGQSSQNWVICHCQWKTQMNDHILICMLAQDHDALSLLNIERDEACSWSHQRKWQQINQCSKMKSSSMVQWRDKCRFWCDFQNNITCSSFETMAGAAWCCTWSYPEFHANTVCWKASGTTQFCHCCQWFSQGSENKDMISFWLHLWFMYHHCVDDGVDLLQMRLHCSAFTQ